MFIPPVLAAAALLTAMPAHSSAAVPKITGGKFSNCFWHVGVVNSGAINIAYPDAGANYWGAIYTLPEGAKLSVKGTYPHARYASMQSYNALGQVVDAAADYQIAPDKGSVNPFRPGVSRKTRHRAFTLRLNGGSPPKAVKPDPRSNEPTRRGIYTKPSGDTTGVHYLVWRDYIPDRGRDLRGGVSLPKPVLTLKDGSVQTGKQLCKTVTSLQARLPDISSLLVPKAQYDKLRYQPGKPAYFPARKQANWRAQYTRPFLLALYTGQKFTNLAKGGVGGFFPNLHNQYVRNAISRKLGKVVAFRGKMPTTEKTFDGNRTVHRTQLRYLSFCMNESVLTTRVMDCAYDEEIPLHGKRRYVVVTSRAADRPRNATKKCGVAWVRWSPRGDGGRDHDFGWMQIRNMLPSPSFHHSVQDTRKPGDEKKVMGPYLPSTKYYAGKRAFEKLGCPAR